MPSADPFIVLAYCLRARNDLDGAAVVLAEATRVEPGNPVVQANIGLVAFDQGRLSDAIDALDAALRGQPDLHEARFTLARALALIGKQDLARVQVETLLQRMPAGAPQRPEVERLLASLR
jgi:cytochrome c-type biogenesis protein CcmH/NrfG